MDVISYLEAVSPKWHLEDFLNFDLDARSGQLILKLSRSRYNKYLFYIVKCGQSKLVLLMDYLVINVFYKNLVAFVA